MTAVAFAADPLVVTTCGAGAGGALPPRLHVCNIDTGECRGVIDGISGCSLQPDLATAVCSMADGAVCVVDTNSARQICVLDAAQAPAAGQLAGQLAVGAILASNLEAAEAEAAAEEAPLPEYACTLSLGGHAASPALAPGPDGGGPAASGEVRPVQRCFPRTDRSPCACRLKPPRVSRLGPDIYNRSRRTLGPLLAMFCF